MKTMIKKIVTRLFPELNNGTHLPQLAVVTAIPDPPKTGEQHTHERPFFAVDVRLLKSDGAIDDDMPLMRDIPVAMAGAAPDRGFAVLPQPGTIVELAFAFGMQSKPFVRSVLPWGMKLPQIDDKAQRWQQNANSYQEVDASGNWIRKTDKDIFDQAPNTAVDTQNYCLSSSKTTIEQSNLNIRAGQIHFGGPAAKAAGQITFQRLNTATDLKIPAGTIISNITGELRIKTTTVATIPAGNDKITVPAEALCGGDEYNLGEGQYCRLVFSSLGQLAVYNEDEFSGGTKGDNKLVIDSNLMQALISAFDTLGTHTHPNTGTISEGGSVAQQSQVIQELKTKLDSFTKT